MKQEEKQDMFVHYIASNLVVIYDLHDDDLKEKITSQQTRLIGELEKILPHEPSEKCLKKLKKIDLRDFYELEQFDSFYKRFIQNAN